MADALAHSRDIGSLPHSPIPFLRSHAIPFQHFLTTVSPPSSWHWAGPEGLPPLGNLRAMLSYHRALAYRMNRDALRAQRGAPPIWLDTLQTAGATAWLHRSQPLRKRVQALRTFWDLRWHGENQAVAAKTEAPQVSACPICHRFWSQAHVLGDCPSTADARTGGSLDLTLAVSRLPPGPMLELDRKFQSLLSTYNQPTLMARRWAGQWDQVAIRSLQPEIARCTRKQIKAVLGHIGRVTSTTAATCWRDLTAMAKDLSPPRDPSPPPALTGARQQSTIEWDPRLGEDHG